ncbi:DUF1972 domain-containing protein [Aureimonas sp. AU20]|uniref:DUF1972 domain-containing protein n=1 Tax=Aureimonas sp. AU20 TaxID=1349819 RepID=UPI000722AD0D|nr:DUF1972 domain-containing protein [Aureimonas sp. AU20]ALN74860.1 hypothetical protein M673_19225 [Aureimonas sp. AU20]
MPDEMSPILRILGTRGVPAAHGGFETFAEQLSLFLVARGWRVVVYCQHDVSEVTEGLRTDIWRGVELVHIQIASTGPKSTLEFDWKSVRHAGAEEGLCLVLGYNSGLFLPYLRLRGKTVLTNMDGMEWRRAKWGPAIKAWFWVNEWIAAWSSHRLIADHPAIADHLATRRPRRHIATIAYGANEVPPQPEGPVRDLALVPGTYLVSIARIEPDNNIHTIVEAFSRRRRGAKLVVLGTLQRGLAYHDRLLKAASDEVVFPGAIYDGAVVAALRYHARAYVHGHTVGGTNPSLVESLAAGNACIAHDNVFNRWTAGEAATYFSDRGGCEAAIEAVLADDALVARARTAARERARSAFRLDDILSAYEREFASFSGYPAASQPLGVLT